MAFNFLSGQSAPQMQQLLQQMQQPMQGPNVAQWAQNPQMPSQAPMAQLAGVQTMPGYAQSPLSNQGANGFSLSDYLQRAQANGFNPQQAMGGLQMMLKGWGSHS